MRFYNLDALKVHGEVSFAPEPVRLIIFVFDEKNTGRYTAMWRGGEFVIESSRFSKFVALSYRDKTERFRVALFGPKSFCVSLAIFLAKRAIWPDMPEVEENAEN